MPVKLVQYWDVLKGKDGPFDDFFSSEFVPRINDTGLMMLTGSWRVASGEGPTFITEGVSRAIKDVEKLITAPSFIQLRRKLLSLVENYHSKLLVPTGVIPAKPVEIEHGYKFNQHYNVNPQDFYAFKDFEREEQMPGLESFGLEMLGGWYVAVGSTPHIIAEGRVEEITTIGKMLQDPAYREMTLKLLGLVSCYGCKILVPSGHINR
ncbi:MAG: hypothetical protein JRH13_00335 [Deltaproteobacteria bacterium]|nr:hypothetical protein [Deltaproteobacteria bacterium]MBW2015265.1 hypothetical protein [Deltaproteobacteria bacterium]MBW2127797.1 hypothetical protein [Deltaproteobacteria bacterium]MBW2302081.1 hypothetical protein [Deltaproteobacteria bacterium]